MWNISCLCQLLGPVTMLEARNRSDLFPVTDQNLVLCWWSRMKIFWHTEWNTYQRISGCDLADQSSSVIIILFLLLEIITLNEKCFSVRTIKDVDGEHYLKQNHYFFSFPTVQQLYGHAEARIWLLVFKIQWKHRNFFFGLENKFDCQLVSSCLLWPISCCPLSLS